MTKMAVHFLQLGARRLGHGQHGGRQHVGPERLWDIHLRVHDLSLGLVPVVGHERHEVLLILLRLVRTQPWWYEPWLLSDAPSLKTLQLVLYTQCHRCLSYRRFQSTRIKYYMRILNNIDALLDGHHFLRPRVAAAASLQHVPLELGHVVAGKLLRRRTRVIGRLLGIARMRLVPAVLDIVVCLSVGFSICPHEDLDLDHIPTRRIRCCCFIMHAPPELCADGTMYVPSTADGGCRKIIITNQRVYIRTGCSTRSLRCAGSFALLTQLRVYDECLQHTTLSWHLPWRQISS